MLEISFLKVENLDKSKEQSKQVEPFKEAVSVQNVEHSSKHAVFLSGEVQSSFRKLFSLRSTCSISFKTPDSYTICSV